MKKSIYCNGKLPKKHISFNIRLKNAFLKILCIIICPFYILYNKIINPLFKNIFFDKICLGDNGIIGPGYHVFYETKFSWGKL